MKVVELYILRRTVGIFLATLFWVLAIVWTTQVLTRINVVTSNGQSAATFFELAWLVLPAVIPVVIPFAVGIAVAQTLSTMNTDSELIVITAAGSPRSAVMRPILLLAVAACVVSFSVNNLVEPYSRERLRYLIADARAELITTVIQEGAFQKIEDGLHMQIGERRPDGSFAGIFVSDTREPDTELIYYAQTGSTIAHEGQQLLVMQDGVVQRKAGENVSIVRYKSYALDLAQFTAGGAHATLMPKDRTIAYLMNPDPDDPIYQRMPQRYRAELHRRFTEWLYPLVFALIGLAVAGDSRSFREARIHPLLTTMTIAMLVRWAGFFTANKVETVAAFTPVTYIVPIAGCLIAIGFIATNTIMELPTSVAERIQAAWGRAQKRIAALRMRGGLSRRSA